MGKLGKKYLLTFYGRKQEINPPTPHLLISHTCSSSARSLFAQAALSSDLFSAYPPMFHPAWTWSAFVIASWETCLPPVPDYKII